MANAIHHVQAVMTFPTHVPDFTKLGRGMVTAMTNNPHFPTPNPTLASVTAALDDVDAAETVASTRARGSAKARDLKITNAKKLLRALKSYVQSVADETPEQAQAIIESAGLTVKKATVRPKQTNEVKQGVSGVVDLFAIVDKLATAHEWQSSLDGINWTPLPTTSQARTSVAGLTPGKVYYFRTRPILRKGAADWSQPFSILVK